MAKGSKKDAKKKKKKHVLDSAAESVKKFRRVTREIGKLNTAQKIIGGVALLAAGLAYLAKREADQAAGISKPDTAADEPAALPEAAADGEDPSRALGPGRAKAGKRRPAGKAHH